MVHTTTCFRPSGNPSASLTLTEFLEGKTMIRRLLATTTFLIIFQSMLVSGQQVSVNFGSRNTPHAIGPNIFGAERFDSMHTTADLELLKAGGMNYARYYAQINTTFSTPTANWAYIDSVIARTSVGGTHVMLQMFQTPPWLQYKYCGVDSMPANLSESASIGVQYVKHMDTKFPGVVTDYEMWNEPNLNFCAPTGTSLSNYLKWYDAVVPAMRAQIKADGSKARVGGPALAGLDSSWIQALLADPIASKNVDFISYHNYIFGFSNDNWATVYQLTQTAGNGPHDIYWEASHLVAAAGQPNLPIYNTEYNLSWEFAKNCCQDDPVYGPLWNSIYIADTLNAVYTGSANVIAHMVYYAANAHPYYCLVGDLDANMDCAYAWGPAAQAYPSYYAYQLYGSPQYLGLQNGGHMAASVSPAIGSSGYIVTGFYTAGSDSVVLINPTGSTYSGLHVTLSNTGYTSASATLFTIENGSHIQGTSLSLSSQGATSYTTTVTLEPYSVQAIRIE